MMILATISLADPGSRDSRVFDSDGTAIRVPWFFYVFYGNVLLIVLMAAWDWWRGRLVRSFVVGASALLVAEYVATCLYFWGRGSAHAGMGAGVDKAFCLGKIVGSGWSHIRQLLVDNSYVNRGRNEPGLWRVPASRYSMPISSTENR